MKVTEEHYTLIKDQIAKAIDNSIKAGKVENRKGFFQLWEAQYESYTAQRKVWDLYWGTGGNKWKEIAFNGNPYGGDYNDAHIETALKKAYKELMN